MRTFIEKVADGVEELIELEMGRQLTPSERALARVAFGHGLQAACEMLKGAEKGLLEEVRV